MNSLPLYKLRDKHFKIDLCTFHNSITNKIMTDQFTKKKIKNDDKLIYTRDALGQNRNAIPIHVFDHPPQSRELLLSLHIQRGKPYF